VTPADEASRPLVSVIVPTFERPQLVLRAVRSALAQTVGRLEAIVVVDGRDEATCAALLQIHDARLRVIVPARHLGNADARNVGIADSRGRWVALLDDDDFWLPEKLELQLRTAERSAYAQPIVSCRLRAETGAEEFVWPKRHPRENEPLSEYLFCRTKPFNGEGMVQTSTIFASGELLRQVPFCSGLKRFVDIDWLLRVVKLDGVGVEFVSTLEPLVVWHIEYDRTRISRTNDWRHSLGWIQQSRHLFTPRAYAAFLLTLISATAADEQDRRAFAVLGREAYRHGSPGWAEIVTHIGNFTVSERARRRIAAWWTKLSA
jgi:glycosyltransferase involved in cell wall biosynthesis